MLRHFLMSHPGGRLPHYCCNLCFDQNSVSQLSATPAVWFQIRRSCYDKVQAWCVGRLESERGEWCTNIVQDWLTLPWNMKIFSLKAWNVSLDYFFPHMNFFIIIISNIGIYGQIYSIKSIKSRKGFKTYSSFHLPKSVFLLLAKTKSKNIK